MHKEAKAKEPQINIDIIMLSLSKHFPSFQLGERSLMDRTAAIRVCGPLY